MRIYAFAFLLLTLGLGSGPAQAQFAPGPAGRTPSAEHPSARNQPGKFDYYALALSWSPTYCDGATRNQNDPQCNRAGGRPYAFVLHGLWPQHQKGWPENCATGGSAYVPRPLTAVERKHCPRWRNSPAIPSGAGARARAARTHRGGRLRDCIVGRSDCGSRRRSRSGSRIEPERNNRIFRVGCARTDAPPTASGRPVQGRIEPEPGLNRGPASEEEMRRRRCA